MENDKIAGEGDLVEKYKDFLDKSLDFMTKRLFRCEDLEQWPVFQELMQKRR